MDPRSSLEQMLGETGTTVTAVLEALVGEPVDAHDRAHEMIEASVPNLLGVAEGHSLLARSALLRGRVSHAGYLWAESVLVPSRLPDGFCQRLERTLDPIGRILGDGSVEFSKHMLTPGEGEQPSPSAQCLVPAEYLFSRSYRVDIEDVAVMVIAEWFLPDLAKFLEGP